MATRPEIKWTVQNNNLSGSGGATGGSLFVTKNGDIYLGMAVATIPSNTRNHLDSLVTSPVGGADSVLQKWDTNGTRIWSRAGTLFNHGGSDDPRNIFVDDNGFIYVGAYCQGAITGITASGNRDSVIFKFNQDITQRIWAVASPISASGNDTGQRSTYDPVSGASYLTMLTTGSVSAWTGPVGTVTNLGNDDIIIGKVSNTGVVEWVVQNSSFNTSGWDQPQWLAVGPDGHLVVAFTRNTSGSGVGYDSHLMKLDKTNGSVLWLKSGSFNSSSFNDGIGEVKIDTSGNIYAIHIGAGTLTGTTAIGGQDILIHKFNSSGDRLWVLRSPLLNTTVNESSPAMDIDTSGNIYIAYLSAGTISGESKIGGDDITIAKITTAGVVEWVWTPTQLNTTSGETNPRIMLDKYRNMYLYYTTGIPLTGYSGPSAGRNNVLTKLGPVEQISYDPADSAPPTPILTQTTVTNSPIAEDSIPNGFSIDSILTSLGSNLVSTSQNNGIAIYSANTTNGNWYYSLNNGTLWIEFPVVSETNYLLLNGINTIIRYIPNANSTTSTTIQFRAWNGQTFVAGTATQISYGDGTPFSEGYATISIPITAINDAPTMNDAVYILPNLSTLNTDSGIDLQSIMNTFNITDVDISSNSVSDFGIAIISVDSTLGDWEYSETNGSSWAPFIDVSISSAIHFSISNTTLIRFAPTTTTSIGTTTLTFVAWDKTNADSIVNKRGNVTTRGGATPYSVTVGTVSRAVVAPPTVPRAIKANIDDGTITFSWTPPLFNGYNDSLTYTIYDASGSAISTTTGATATITTDTTMQPYSFSISANNGILEGPKSSSITYMGSPVLQPIQRANMQLELSWSSPFIQGSSGLIIYTLINADTNSILETGITDTSYIVSGSLVAGQLYRYKIQATMNGISTLSNIQEAIVPYIPTPSILPPTIGNEQITILWDNVSSQVQGGTFLGYKIYYRKEGLSEYVTSLISETTTTITGLQGDFSSLVIESTSATFLGLSNGSLYRFRIVSIVNIDGVEMNSYSTPIIRAIPIAPTVSVVTFTSSISSTVADNDINTAINTVNQMTETITGTNTVAQSFSSLAIGTEENKSAGATVLVGLPTASASSILKAILSTESSLVKSALLENAIQANSSQVGNIIASLDTLSEQKSAIASSVKTIVENTSASILSAAISAGFINSQIVAKAVGATDISNRISVNTLQSNLSSVVSNFTSAITELKQSSFEQRNDIISGVAEEILKQGKSIQDSNATESEKTNAKVNAITAVLKEANAGDADTQLKNTFVSSIRASFSGQTIPVSGDAKTELLSSIPSGRIATELLNQTAPISIIVPEGTEIQLSTITPNQFLAMEINTLYTFKNKDDPTSSSVSATYKQSEAGIRYLEFTDSSTVELGGNVYFFGHPFFLAAVANPILEPATAPFPPTNLVATVDGTSATIAFTPGNDGGAPITGYSYSTNGTTFSSTNLTWVSGQSTVTIRGLPNNQTLSFYLKAINSIGSSQSSSVSNSITTIPLNIPCIVKGQRILTPSGYVPIETLRCGDRILTPKGDCVPIRIYSTTLKETTVKTAPVRVKGPNGDVLVSPLHAFKVNANGWMLPEIAIAANIPGVIQEPIGKSVQYFHIETPNYLTDDLVVEGLIVESFGANYIKRNGINPKLIYTKNKFGNWYERISYNHILNRVKK